MISIETCLPQGFALGRHPMISARLAERIAAFGRRVPPQRVLIVLASGAQNDEASKFFAQSPQWAAALRGPGIFEARLTPDDIGQVTAKEGLFRWVDASGPLTGEVVTDPSATLAVKVFARAGASLKDPVAALGGRLSGQGSDGGYLGVVPGKALGDLLMCDGLEAIEVTGTT
ncbi:MAG: hypothetical protein ACYS22_18630 [Planctomycetota bacterium]|jgi:hypothetical protein